MLLRYDSLKSGARRLLPALLLSCGLLFAPAAEARESAAAEAPTAEETVPIAGETEAAAGETEAATLTNPPLEYLCAWVSLASYEDRVGIVARRALAAMGWTLQPYREENDRVAAKYYFMRSEIPEGRRYLLAVTGTSDLKDIKTDMRMHKAPFAGKTPEEFKREAARGKMKPTEPLAHKGFVSYTQTAFFEHVVNGRTFGEELRDTLLADPEAKLCVTGHSLGGAVAVLLAARLMAMGVPAEQLDVVTFGAPAVGNRAFADAYADMRLDRIAMGGDPVHTAVQSVDTSYVQFGSLQRWHRPRGSERFPHAMTGYVDVALRKYFDDLSMKRREEARMEETGETGGLVPRVARAEAERDGESPRVLLIADYALDDPIAGDLPYMQLATIDNLRRETEGLVVGSVTTAGTAGAELIPRALKAAKEAGCRYALLQHYASKRLRDKREGYTISLEEALYDEYGNPLVLQSFTTNTDAMTPILAALYNEAAGNDARRAAMAGGE